MRWCENSVKFYSTEFLDHHFCSFPPQGFRFVVTNTQKRVASSAAGTAHALLSCWMRALLLLFAHVHNFTHR